MRKTPEERIEKLAHENHLLKQKIQILELEVEIEKRKLAAYRASQPTGYTRTPPGVTWNPDGWIHTTTTNNSDVKRFTDQIARSMRKMGGTYRAPGTPPVS